jgi:hypothetical protein
MAMPSSSRAVRLLDARDPAHPIIRAELYRDYPAVSLDDVEQAWAKAREEAVSGGQVEGLAPLEHAHWNWRRKSDTVNLGVHMLVAVECEGGVQGLMALLRLPRPAKLGTGHVVYVDYVETAPWNLKGSAIPPRFLGVGTMLIAEAVRVGIESGLSGAVGLHSLPQAEAFYTKIGMTRFGPDPDYYDLTYFEYDGQKATDWLAAIGEVT